MKKKKRKIAVAYKGKKSPQTEEVQGGPQQRMLWLNQVQHFFSLNTWSKVYNRCF